MTAYVDYGKGWRAHKTAARRMATKRGHTPGPWKSTQGAQWADCTECGLPIWANWERHYGEATNEQCKGKRVEPPLPWVKPRYWYTLGRVD